MGPDPTGDDLGRLRVTLPDHDSDFGLSALSFGLRPDVDLPAASAVDPEGRKLRRSFLSFRRTLRKGDAPLPALGI
jgi:hypothetical protein